VLTLWLASIGWVRDRVVEGGNRQPMVGHGSQARRLRAAELFALGVRQAEVARQLGVSPQAVSVWHARWKAGGTDALRSRGPTGPTLKVSDAQLGHVE
jgi:transposase